MLLSISTFAFLRSALAIVLPSYSPQLNLSSIPVGAFEDVISRRLDNFKTWPRLQIISLSIRSSEKNIYLGRTNSVEITAYAPEINSIINCYTERNTDPVAWSWTHTSKLPAGEPPPETWSWQRRNIISLDRALAILRQQGYSNTWLSAQLGIADETQNPPYQLVYKFEKQTTFFWQPKFIKMLADTGRIVPSWGDQLTSGGDQATNQSDQATNRSDQATNQSDQATNPSDQAKIWDGKVLAISPTLTQESVKVARSFDADMPTDAFESTITERVNTLALTFPRLRMVEVAIISLTEDVSKPSTNTIRITARVGEVYGNLHTSTIPGPGRVQWTSPEYEYAQPGAELRKAWLWSTAQFLSLQTVLARMAAREYPGPWLAITLSEDVPPSSQVPLGLLYSLHWPSRSHHWKPLYVSAVTGEWIDHGNGANQTNGYAE